MFENTPFILFVVTVYRCLYCFAVWIGRPVGLCFKFAWKSVRESLTGMDSATRVLKGVKSTSRPFCIFVDIKMAAKKCLNFKFESFIDIGRQLAFKRFIHKKYW